MTAKTLLSPRLQSVRFLSDAQEGRAVKLGAGDKTVTAVTAATDNFIGITAYGDAEANRDGQIFREGGDAIAEAGAVIAKGAQLKLDGQGRVISSGNNERSIGVALEASTAAGQLIAIQFTRFKS